MRRLAALALLLASPLHALRTHKLIAGLFALLLLAGVFSPAAQALPLSYKWWAMTDGTLSFCKVDAQGQCKVYNDWIEACRDVSNYSGGANPSNIGGQVVQDDEIRTSYECRASIVNGFQSCQAPNTCGIFPALQRRDQAFCPDNSTMEGNSCVCKPGSQEVGGRCSGGDNNAIACPSCGNPTNPANGNKFEEIAVYRGLNGFELSLSFNTYDEFLTRFGRRWRDSFNRRVSVEGTDAIAYRHDGRTLRFTPNGSAWVADADTPYQLTQTQTPAGWQLVSTSGDEVETYDASGNLLTIKSRSGLTQTLTYSDGTTGANGGVVHDAAGDPTSVPIKAGLLIRASDAFGRVITFAYDGPYRVVKLTDPAGGVYRFAYVTLDKLSTITFPDGKVRTYVYNETAHTPQPAGLREALTGIVDENNGRYATFTYDADARVVSSEHAGGALRHQFSYTTGSTSVTDPLNTVRTYGFNVTLGAFKNTGITGSACPNCGPASQTFDANGSASSRTDWNANRTNYTYDAARALETSRTEALTSAGASTPQTRTISTEWHATFRLPLRTAEPLRITTYAYDADGTQCGARGAVCSKSVQATTDANGSLGFSATPVGTARAWTYTYDANGSVLTVNGPRTDVSDVTTYTYYANNDADLGKRGNVATITNAAGHVTSITSYNGHGQPLTIVDPNGLTTTLAYDSRQRLTSRTAGTEVTSYEYDGVGQLTKVTLPDSSYLTYTYDGAHRLTAVQDNLGNKISYTLDAMGNRTLEEVRDPVNALVQKRSREYSALNRLFKELGALNQTTEYTYDDQGNVATVKDPLLRTTSNQYDALNRLKQVTSPAPVSAVTQYAYNGLDALTQVTDPRSLVTGYTVDGLGNLTSQASPDTGTTSSTYDDAGNLLTQTDAKSQVTTYAYDALNRVTLITFHDGSKQTYAYDAGTNALGRLSSITETNAALQQTSLTQYAYDQQGRVTSETRTLGGVAYVVAYTYDSSGRMTGSTYPSGRTVTYGFDSLGRVNQVNTTKPGQAQVVAVQNVQYHPFGGVKSFTLGNGQIYSRSIDQDGRVASFTLGATNYALTFDNASRITGIGTSTYGYDSLDRLTSAVLSASNYGYSYDAVGNRLTKTTGANTDTYTYGTTSNRIATLTPSGSAQRSFVLDANGSTTSDGLNTYAYDVRGRMVQATSGAGTSTYQVNALGQRVKKSTSTADTVFHYDTRGRLVAETDAAGAVKRELIYLGDIPVAVYQ